MSIDEMSLMDSHAKIQTREDLAAFVAVLKKDLQEHPEKWENAELYAFLDAMQSWVEAMEWYYKNHDREMPDPPTWQMIGDILMGARIYE
jgi:predicted translin family RNA/ssDNA-binding protein